MEAAESIHPQALGATVVVAARVEVETVAAVTAARAEAATAAAVTAARAEAEKVVVVTVAVELEAVVTVAVATVEATVVVHLVAATVAMADSKAGKVGGMVAVEVTGQQSGKRRSLRPRSPPALRAKWPHGGCAHDTSHWPALSPPSPWPVVCRTRSFPVPLHAS